MLFRSQCRLGDLDDLLHGAPLESLEVDGSNVVVDAHDPSAWFDVFHAFPRLEKVYVKYLSSVENFKAFWSGLRKASSVGIVDHVIRPTTGDHGPPRPHIRHIGFSLWFTEDLIEPSFNLATEEMLLYLRERSMVGARLELLKWDRLVGSISLHPQVVDATRALLARLEREGLVGEVVVVE